MADPTNPNAVAGFAPQLQEALTKLKDQIGQEDCGPARLAALEIERRTLDALAGQCEVILNFVVKERDTLLLKSQLLGFKLQQLRLRAERQVQEPVVVDEG